MNASAPSNTLRGSLLGSALFRLVIPTWLLLGAAIKLSERSPMLLPSPVRDVLQRLADIMGLGSQADYPGFLDGALRVIVGTEFVLAFAMLLLPRFSRMIALPLLGMFVLILGIVVARGEASCGCFGSKGPSPTVVLVCDVLLLAAAMGLRPRVQPATPLMVGLWMAMSATGFALAFAVPAKSGLNMPQQAEAETIVVQETPPPVPTGPSVDPGPAAQPSPTESAAWPKPPATLQPWYLPQFEQWVGKPLRDQPLAALITPAPPADLEKGRWIVMFFREDCEHCHTVLDAHFSPAVPLPTLLVSVPDADPAAALPNPCGQCQVRSLPKGPDWIVGTPVLLSVEDGVVKGFLGGTDPEDPDKVQALLEFR
jgi:hypothetical protein